MISVEEINLRDLIPSLGKLKKWESEVEKAMSKIEDLIGNAVPREVSRADEELKRLQEDLLRDLKDHNSLLAERKDTIRKAKTIELKKQRHELNRLTDSISHIHETVTSCLDSDNASSKASCRKFFLDSIQEKLLELEAVSLEPCAVEDVKVLGGRSDILQFLRDHVDVVSPADPTKCTAVGALHSGTVGRTNELALQTQYRNSQPCFERQNVAANLEHCSSGRVFPCTVEQDAGKIGVYIITYQAKERGRYKLVISVNGDSVCGSPFDVTMYKFFGKGVEVVPHKKINNLSQPFQVAFTTSNEMLVTQKGTNSIKKLQSNDCSKTFDVRDRKHTILNTFKPTGIAIDKENNVYVSYENIGSILKFDIHGEMQEKTPDGELHRPGRLFYCERTKELLVCERGEDRVQVYDSKLNQVRQFADGIRCSSVTCDEDGTAYVADKNGCNIHKFDSEGNCMGQLFEDKKLRAPRGICLQNGHMFIADRDNSRVIIVDNYSTSPEIVNEYPLSDQDFGSVATDVNGYVYICHERYDYVLVL
jgi:tripartite motif-containing protein 2/3